MRLTVRADELRPDDFCRGSRTRILGTPRKRGHLPSSKVEIKVQHLNGSVRWVVWGASTKIGIERNA